MRTYGLKIEELEEIKSLIQKYFSKIDDCKVYLFGSRANGLHKPFSDIDLAIKSNSKKLSSQISLFLEGWEQSKIPYKVDISDWKELFKPYLPQINKEKILLWSTNQEKLPMRVCPYGESWVRRHDRMSKNGKLEDVDGHCRKNRGGKDVLYSDEIRFISSTKAFLFSNTKICPYRGNEHILMPNQYDQLIVGWCNYWNQIFNPKILIDPNFVKALIFSESRFDSKSFNKNSKKIGLARGLVQITESTLKILKDRKGEIKDHYIDLKKEDLFDPSLNICAAIRWLFRKNEILEKRLKRTPEWVEVIVEYKGLGNQLKNNDKEALKVMKNFNSALKDFEC